MESDDVIAARIDQTYKSLLENFNPTARQLINAGKAYLKSLQGAADASRVYLEILAKLAREAKESPTGASLEIGQSLSEAVDVYKEIQFHQDNILSSFLNEFVIPLETHLEKDTKVLQAEHKKFFSSHKQKKELLVKAENSLRKQRKKKSNNNEKEVKMLERFHDHKNDMEIFLDHFIKNATRDEMHRYSFVLERLCSFSYHLVAYHERGAILYQKDLEEWSNMCENPVACVPTKQVENEQIYETPAEDVDERITSSKLTSLVKRSHSLDGFLDNRRSASSDKKLFSDDSMSPQTRNQSQEVKNEQFIKASYECLSNIENETTFQKTENVIKSKDDLYLKLNQNLDMTCDYARAVYDFDTTTNNQLALDEGDIITLIGVIDNGWQYGENQRTRMIGWFPMAYTEIFKKNNNFCFGRECDSSKKKTKTVRQNKKNSKSPRSVSSSGDSNTKKSFDTYNSHLFLSSDMEEDLKSYEGSYCENRGNSDKLTNFGGDYSVSPSLCRSLTSPELPDCFRKSISSKDSIQCSDDSGFSNEENVHPNQRAHGSSSYSESSSKSPNQSWVTDSFAACEECNPKTKIQSPPAEKPSPVFLNYLYPAVRSSGSSLRYSSSVEGLDEIKARKRENWIINTFGTFGRKKKNLVSPCAQKIATQKARRKNERVSLARSSSLLCIDMTSCADGSGDELYASNYEPIDYTSWQHVPQVPQGSLPAPPPFEPPPLPNKCSSLKTQLYIQQQNILKGQLHDKLNQNSKSKSLDSSSGNSSWSESTCLEAYMVVKDHSRDVKENRQRRIIKSSLNRSKTWGAPDTKKIQSKFFGSPRRHKSRDSQSKNDETSYPKSPPPKPIRKTLTKIKKKTKKRTEDEAPPLPPRRRQTFHHRVSKNDVNIFNYSEYMMNRLSNPDGTCRFDQRSFTTGQKCSAWYDLWENNAYGGKLI